MAPELRTPSGQLDTTSNRLRNRFDIIFFNLDLVSAIVKRRRPADLVQQRAAARVQLLDGAAFAFTATTDVSGARATRNLVQDGFHAGSEHIPLRDQAGQLTFQLGVPGIAALERGRGDV